MSEQDIGYAKDRYVQYNDNAAIEMQLGIAIKIEDLKPAIGGVSSLSRSQIDHIIIAGILPGGAVST